MHTYDPSYSGRLQVQDLPGNWWKLPHEKRAVECEVLGLILSREILTVI